MRKASKPAPAGGKRTYRRRAVSTKAAASTMLRPRGGATITTVDGPGRGMVTVSTRDLEDLIDGVEAARRLADPVDGERLSWAETKARLGL